MSARRLIPLLDRVVVRRVKAMEKTSSGILIPEKAQSAQNEAEVVEVGPGAVHPQTGKLQQMSLKKGDKVLLPPYGGTNIKLNEDELIVLRENDLLGKFSE